MFEIYQMKSFKVLNLNQATHSHPKEEGEKIYKRELSIHRA